MQRRHAVTSAAVAFAASLLLVSAAVAARSAPARGEAATIAVTLRDFSIKLSAKTAPVGKVTFSVENAGRTSHNFAIAGKKTPVLGSGKSARLVVTFAKAGPFAYSSTVAGDAKKGMKGTLTLKASPAAGGTTHAGQELFLSTGCGSCHTFKAAGTTGSIGPNLDRSTASRARIVGVVTAGKGVMQAYAGMLTTDEIKDVADFLFTSRGG